MGQLIYAGSSYDIPDPGLVMLDAVTRHAFSEGKSFMLVLQGTAVEDDGVVAARSIWFSPHVPVQFLYQDYETIQISRDTFDEYYNSVVDCGICFLGDGPLPYEFTGEHPASSSD